MHSSRESPELRAKYDKALEQFIERMKQDSNILAIYVFGSYVNKTLAGHSDIDTFIITNDDRASRRFLVLRENDVSIEAFIFSRMEFRRRQQSFIQGGMIHHLFAESRLVYSKDDTITDINRETALAERDKELQLMLAAEWLVACLQKAQKSLYIFKDVDKAFYWFPLLVQQLARILLLLNDRIPGRDLLAQARDSLTTGRELLSEVITKAFKEAFSEANLDEVLKLIENFLIEKKNQLYKPLFSYLSEAADARSYSEIDLHFRRAFGNREMFAPWVSSIEWLAQQGDLMRATAPVRIASKSRVTADETTFYYIGDA
ncbi:MAG: nucleotidyltransferase domain-containing protein [Candidatus Thorarchaeota archaeon]